MIRIERAEQLRNAADPVAGTGRLSGLAGLAGRWWRARTQAPRQLRLIETLPLGPKRSVALIELDGQRFLAGMGADGVSTLLQVSQPAEVFARADVR